MEQPDAVLVELRGRLERLGYVVAPHGDHLCVRLPLLTSVRVRRAATGAFTFVPQFGPFGRSAGLMVTTGAATAAVAAAAVAGFAPVIAVAGFAGLVALAHDACRFVLTEGALTRLQLLATEAGGLAPGHAAGAPADAALAPPPAARLPEGLGRPGAAPAPATTPIGRRA
jgi:hypothetical protein